MQRINCTDKDNKTKKQTSENRNTNQPLNQSPNHPRRRAHIVGNTLIHPIIIRPVGTLLRRCSAIATVPNNQWRPPCSSIPSVALISRVPQWPLHIANAMQYLVSCEMSVSVHVDMGRKGGNSISEIGAAARFCEIWVVEQPFFCFFLEGKERN